MTLKEAEAAYAEIEAKQGDDEVAHIREDELRKRVLEAVAAGCNQFHAQKLAKIALRSEKLEFARWCA